MPFGSAPGLSHESEGLASTKSATARIHCPAQNSPGELAPTDIEAIRARLLE